MWSIDVYVNVRYDARLVDMRGGVHSEQNGERTLVAMLRKSDA